jgi:hypothetical protein
MSTVAAVAEQMTRGAPSVFALKAEHWASSYAERPLVAMRVGLRMLSDEELESCRRDADKATEEAYKADQSSNLDRIHRRKLMRSAVSRALCDVDNASSPHEHFPCPDEQLDIALREETIVTLFDVVERTQIENSPVFVPASDDDIAELIGVLADGALTDMEAADVQRSDRIRRLMAFVLTELSNG